MLLFRNPSAFARPLVAVGALLLAGCAHQPALTSRYAPAPITVDGNAAEWPNELQYDRDSHLQYQVLNDQKTLYLRLLAADQPTQRLLLRGLTVWLDTTGHNHKQLGIQFPLGRPGAGRPQNEPAGEGSTGTPGERRRPQLAELREMQLLNYHGQAEPLLTDNLAPLGVRAALGFDVQDNLVYELAVPLRVLYRRLPASGKALVGITLAGTPRPASMAGGGGGMGGAGGGGRGGRGSGGMGGGGMGGSGMRGGGGMGGGRMGGPSGGGSQQTLNLKTSVQLTGQP